MITTADVLGRNALIPLGVSYGMGVDSTAMLVEMVKRGIRPDIIQFADTGAELPATYDYMPVINEFLAAHGFPTITVVRKNSKYKGLYENCLGNETLPSLAFGKKGCSLKWKVDPMQSYMNKWAPAKACWKAGFKVIKAIGYDGGARDKQRFCQSAESEAKRAAQGKGDKKYDYWYPLIEWAIDREACVETIRAAGLRVPCKSACFMCPARKRAEVVVLKTNHPELYQLSVNLETTARDGKHGLKSTKGLGRNWAWAEVEVA
jgi:hypothetical protein